MTSSEDTSTGLGLHIRKTRIYVAIIVVLLASIAAAYVGSVGFIGLLAPHAARMLVGSKHRKSMDIAALLSGIQRGGLDWPGSHDSEGAPIWYRNRAAWGTISVVLDESNQLAEEEIIFMLLT